MVKKAIIRANIPFILDDADVIQDILTQSAIDQGWEKQEMHGSLLLRHINTSFAKNVVCFSKQTDEMSFVVPAADPRDSTKMHKYPFRIGQVQVYCFDTGIGICSLHIPYDETQEDVVINSCSVLHCSAQHPDSKQGKPILRDEEETYLSCVAEEFLDSLLGQSYMLFGTQSDTNLRRLNMFSAILCEKSQDAGAKEVYERYAYQLANAYDTRDEKLTVKSDDFFHQHEYIRWNFSKRGCAAVANLTGTSINDSFLSSGWFRSVQSNYFYLYLMVLHEKIASYYYLDNIADDPDMDHWKLNQKTLMEFNSKYIFTIVSDEPFVQSVYRMLKKASNADEVYAELQEQLKHMFDYAQIKADEASEATNSKLNLISVIVGVVCSLSVIFDSINFFTSCGCCFGFRTVKDCVFTGVILFEALLFMVVLILVVLANKKTRKTSK